MPRRSPGIRLSVLTLLAAASFMGAGAALPGIPPAAPAQVVKPGDALVELSRPLVLDLTALAKRSLAVRLARAAHAVVPELPLPSAATSGADAELTPLTVDVHVVDPAGGERVVRGGPGPLALPAFSGAPRAAGYWLDIHGGGFDLRFPPAPATYRLDLVPRWPTLVASGTGDLEDVLYGDTIPVSVEVSAGESVASATVAFRSGAGSEWTSAPLAPAEARPARWEAALPRPAGLEVRLDYYVTLRDARGALTRYGTEAEPHHIHLLDPTAPREN